MKEIKIKLKAFGYDENSIEEFCDFCEENKIKLSTYKEEPDTIKHCAIDFLVSFLMSPEIWLSLISNATYDSFKYFIFNIVKKTKSNKYCNSLEMQVNHHKLRIEKETISDEVCNKAIDTFKELVSQDIDNKEFNIITDTTVTYFNHASGEIETVNELEFYKQQSNKSKNKEEQTNGQA